jgi:hypothetical protein
VFRITEGPPISGAAQGDIKIYSHDSCEPFRAKSQEKKQRDDVTHNGVMQCDKRPRVKLAALRAADARRIVVRKHGVAIRESESAVADLRFLAVVMSAVEEGERRYGNFVAVNAPWFESRVLDTWARALGVQRRPTAADISEHFGLTWAQRCAWGIRNLPPVDVRGEQLRTLKAQRRRELDKARKCRRRAKQGKQTREEYRETALANARPWEAAGVSKRTWYRMRKRMKESGTSPSARPLYMFAEQPVPRVDYISSRLTA